MVYFIAQGAGLLYIGTRTSHVLRLLKSDQCRKVKNEAYLKSTHSFVYEHKDLLYAMFSNIRWNPFKRFQVSN